MKKRKASFDLYLLTIGFLIRFILSPFARHPDDVNAWISIGSAIYSGQNPYIASSALLYPPLWALFCTIGYMSYVISNNPFVLSFALKLPIIVADIFISLTIKNIVHNLTGDVTKSRVAMLLYLFNPVTIIFSSLWGMFDAIPTLFALLSLLYLSQGKYLKSGLTLGIGIGFKGFFPALLLPFILLYIWKKETKLQNCLSYTIYSASIPLIISTPFIVMDTNAYIHSLITHAQRLPQNLTYWFPLRLFLEIIGLPSTTIITLSSSLFIVAFSILYFFLSKKANNWPIKQNPTNTKFLLQVSIVVLLAFFITSTTVNEQYIVWILPFLITYITSYDQTLRPFFYALCIFDTLFVILNVGLCFFTPIIEMPPWWINFQYSAPSMILMILTGSLFSAVCITVFLKLIKIVSPTRYERGQHSS